MSEDGGDVKEAEGADGPEFSSERPYQPKSPLWTPVRKPTSLAWVFVGAVGILVLVAMVAVPDFETHFFSGPSQPVKVSVVWVEGLTHPDEETPRYFHYRVQLPDGTQARFSSQQLFRVGDSLIVMCARGRLTGRVKLSTPAGESAATRSGRP